MRRLLITGGAGFIGTNFVRYVLGIDHSVEITVLDLLTYASQKENLQGLPVSRVRLVVGDICDAQLVDELVKETDVVVHFAAETHVDNSLKQPGIFVSSNLVGTFTILEACRKYNKRLHHVSTDEVFGDLPIDSTERFNEESPYQPSSPYSATKAGADFLVRAWIRSFGLMATLSICSNNYGPYQHQEKFIPQQITRILSGQKPVLYGNGKNVRDWIHVEDHVRAIWLILKKGRPSDSYVVGVNGEHSNRWVLAQILRIMGKASDDYEEVADRPGHDLRYALDSSKITDALGFEPKNTEFVKGLTQTIEWYDQHRAFWQNR
ncbi:MAG TPA: dTDP-glucose 4,6-dehydratase [Bavariicoccus seileri]|uniref:dTDP-glucose 4,6-dehydratase n=1 Tax=Bavariicoccus seileri TaxID=549685 RepID=A0A3D4S4V4_9ENTE|nr:dTDP-glucose 4,6-dehydratase [Bavariicoccus seileri]HCS93502.1 dTDP-glucose 4,6-dehydratase [Bavariicoccus seileri]